MGSKKFKFQDNIYPNNIYWPLVVLCNSNNVEAIIPS